MLDPLFLEAFAHRPGGHKVLGRQLHPLCALDLLALEAVNSPLLFDGGEISIPHLIQAVWILSNPHSLDCTISHLELNDEGKEWLKSFGGVIDLAAGCDQIQLYFADYHSLPEVMRNKQGSPLTQLGGPWMLSVIVTVVGALHIPLFEAWTMGIGQLLWIRASIEEQETESRIISPEMRQEMKRAETNGQVMTMEPGETLEDFCKRTGIPATDAAMLLHANAARRN